MKKKTVYFLCLFILIFTSKVQVNAQVSIGGSPNQPPQSFSILELVSGKNDSIGGLRLPQLTEANKTAINADLLNNDKSAGLFIYNTDKACIEYWDGTQWIGPIAGDMLPWQISPGSPLTKSAATVADSIFHTGVVSIGTKDTDPTAVLNVQSSDKGVLVPRMTEAERENIKNPANGLLIYNTDEECFNYYSFQDSTWQSVCGRLGKAKIDGVDCSGIRVYGNYIQKVATTLNERIVIPVNVTREGSYDATVVAMFDANTPNGYTFTGNGTFLYTGMQSITLTAQGTPEEAHFDTSIPPTVGDNILININGTDYDACSQTIIPVIPAAADYDVSCGSAKIYGVYTMAPDNTNSDDQSHYIEVQVNVNDIGIGNATSGWSAETNKVNGVQFRGSGNFTSQGPNTVRLYAVQGIKPTTLDPIVLSMTFQTKNGEVDCQVTLRAAYPPKKIAAFGDTNVYGYSLYTGASKYFLSSDYNFGSKDYSTVKMIDNFPVPANYQKYGAFAYRLLNNDVNSATNWNTIMNDKVDIVVIGYPAAGFSAAGAALALKYLNAGGIIIHFTESSPSYLINAIFGMPNGTINGDNFAGDENLTLPSFADPILNGPFQPEGLKSLGGLDIGGDSQTYLQYVTGLPSTGILVYGYNSSAPTATGPRVSAFRATGQRYFYFGDGGYLTNDDNGSWLNNITEPFATTNDPPLKDGQYRPAVRPATTTGYPNGAYNSFFFGNLIAWAVNEAQFYGINSGN